MCAGTETDDRSRFPPLISRSITMEVDVALERLGYWGKFQLVNYGLLGFPVLFHAIFYFTYVFTAKDADHRCYIPQCESSRYEANISAAPWLHFAAPLDSQSGRPSHCYRYAPEPESRESDESREATTPAQNGTEGERGLVRLLGSISGGGECSADMFSNRTEYCHRRVYDNPALSIVTEWDIACREEWRRTLVGTMSSLGRCVGMPFAGVISDKFGRRTIVLVSLAAAGLCGLLRSFAWSYGAFVSFEFLDTFSYAGLFSAAYILGMELVGSKKRVIWSSFTHSLYAVGEALLGLAAWQLQDWRTLLRVFYIPALLSLVPLWFVPESIRWLVSNGQTKKAAKIIEKAAKINKIVDRELDAGVLAIGFDKQVKALQAETEKKASILQALKETSRSRVLMVRLLNCCFCWLVNMFVYDGLSLYSVAVSGDEYLNFILVCLIEVPGGVGTWLLMRYAGHKAALCISLISSGFFCIVFFFVPSGVTWARVLVYMLGKFGVTISYTVIYVLTAELFPTNIRHSIFALCMTVGRVGSMLAPQTPLLGVHMAALPVIVFGGAATLSGLLALLFPETAGIVLPDTVQDAENIGRGKKAGGGARANAAYVPDDAERPEPEEGAQSPAPPAEAGGKRRLSRSGRKLSQPALGLHPALSHSQLSDYVHDES